MAVNKPPEQLKPENTPPDSPKPVGPGISPDMRMANLDALKERERISRLQEKNLGDFLVKMKATQEPEQARVRDELAKLADIEKLRSAGVTLQENHADYQLKHVRLASSYLAVAESAQNQNGHMEFKVDFQGNENAEWKVGAAHCFPPEVTAIAVYDEHGDPVTTRALRRMKDDRVGYFDEETGEYAHIHSGYRIEVLETGGSSDEKVVTRVAEEKEFFEKDAKKSVLKEGLAKFFQDRGIEITVDDLYFEEFARTNPDAAFEKFFGSTAINLIANFNLAGIKDLTLSDLPELLGNPELKPIQTKRFARKEDLPLDLSEHIIPREIDPDESFVDTVDSYGTKVTLRKTAARMFDRAVRIAKSIGVQLKILSSYRDKEHQERVVARSIEKRGFHDHRFVATPGHSPHHTGGTIDIEAFRNGAKDQGFLQQILPRCGFVNYKLEDWHWEFGTARWRREHPAARGGTYAKILEQKDVVHA